MSSRVSRNQRAYLEFIAHKPGACTADVVRACKWNHRAGHKWVYDSVRRLIRRGFVRAERSEADGRKAVLSLTERGRAALGTGS
jgi:hypothetical protein